MLMLKKHLTQFANDVLWFKLWELGIRGRMWRVLFRYHFIVHYAGFS